jgi:hypothetical protein
MLTASHNLTLTADSTISVSPTDADGSKTGDTNPSVTFHLSSRNAAPIFGRRLIISILIGRVRKKV